MKRLRVNELVLALEVLRPILGSMGKQCILVGVASNKSSSKQKVPQKKSFWGYFLCRQLGGLAGTQKEIVHFQNVVLDAVTLALSYKVPMKQQRRPNPFVSADWACPLRLS